MSKTVGKFENKGWVEGESKQVFLRLVVGNTHLLQIFLLRDVVKQCAVNMFIILKGRR